MSIAKSSGDFLSLNEESHLPTTSDMKIEWNLTASNSRKILSGMYIYRVLVKDMSGNKAESSGKLLIVK